MSRAGSRVPGEYRAIQTFSAKLFSGQGYISLHPLFIHVGGKKPSVCLLFHTLIDLIYYSKGALIRFDSNNFRSSGYHNIGNSSVWDAEQADVGLSASIPGICLSLSRVPTRFSARLALLKRNILPTGALSLTLFQIVCRSFDVGSEITL